MVRSQRRWVLRSADLAVLQASYSNDPFPSRQTRNALAVYLHVRPKQVLAWFQNKRQRDKGIDLPQPVPAQPPASQHTTTDTYAANAMIALALPTSQQEAPGSSALGLLTGFQPQDPFFGMQDNKGSTERLPSSASPPSLEPEASPVVVATRVATPARMQEGSSSHLNTIAAAKEVARLAAEHAASAAAAARNAVAAVNTLIANGPHDGHTSVVQPTLPVAMLAHEPLLEQAHPSSVPNPPSARTIPLVARSQSSVPVHALPQAAYPFPPSQCTAPPRSWSMHMQQAPMPMPMPQHAPMLIPQQTPMPMPMPQHARMLIPQQAPMPAAVVRSALCVSAASMATPVILGVRTAVEANVSRTDIGPVSAQLITTCG